MPENQTENNDSSIKFTDEELNKLGQLQKDYQEKQNLLGQVSVQEILIEQQKEQIHNRRTQLESEYVELQQQELKLVDELNKKYGAGSLNPDTGVFTPNK